MYFFTSNTKYLFFLFFWTLFFRFLNWIQDTYLVWVERTIHFLIPVFVIAYYYCTCINTSHICAQEWSSVWMLLSSNLLSLWVKTIIVSLFLFSVFFFYTCDTPFFYILFLAPHESLNLFSCKLRLLRVLHSLYQLHSYLVPTLI